MEVGKLELYLRRYKEALKTFESVSPAPLRSDAHNDENLTGPNKLSAHPGEIFRLFRLFERTKNENFQSAKLVAKCQYVEVQRIFNELDEFYVFNQSVH